MTFPSNQSTRLSDDMLQIFSDFCGAKSEMVRLCRDHQNPFLHYDKKPVLNITQDEFVGIFCKNSHHYSIAPDQVLRLGTYCRLALPNLIALILKAGWEVFESKESINRNKLSSDYELQSKNQDLSAEYISDFLPDKGKIFKIIRDSPDASNSDIKYSQIDYIISDLMDHHKFLSGNKLVNQIYSGKENTEEILLNKISGEEKEAYSQLKEIWKIKSTELDTLLLNLERKKRLNLSLENKYMGIFGNLEIKKSGIVYRNKKYKALLKIMQEQSGLSLRKLLLMAEEKLIKANKEITELKNKITRSHNCIEKFITGGLPPISDEFRNSYIRECKLLLRKLYFLLHSDTCPGYSGFSGHKRNKINTLWLELMKSTREELFSFSPSMLLYSFPDIDHLESIYKRACEILEIDPECYQLGDRLDFMVRNGSSIQAIIEFLESETTRLEFHLARLELIRDEYTNEEQTQIYRSALENIDMHSEKLNHEIADLKIQVLSLKNEILNKLKKQSHDDTAK